MASEQRPLNILSIDGGGIRGLSAMFILKQLMIDMKQSVIQHSATPKDIPNVLKPCDFFDVIGGTSTGGIFAVMLGTLKMNVDEALDSYKRNYMFKEIKKAKASRLSRVFKTSSSSSTIPLYGAPLFDPDEFDLCISNIIREGRKPVMPRIQRSWTEVRDTQVLVIATDDKNDEPYFFNDLSAHNDSAISRLTQVCHATCALPALLPSVQVGTRTGRPSTSYSALDDSLMNPTSLLLDEVSRIFPGRLPGVVVSIGCGAPPPSLTRISKDWRPLLNTMQGIYRAAEFVAEIDTNKWGTKPTEMLEYCRFDVGEAMAKVGMVEVDDFQRVKRQAEAYCRSHRDSITSCVSKLRLYSSKGWLETIPFESEFREIFDKIMGFRFVTIMHLLARHEELFSKFDNVLGLKYPRILLKTALGVEELLRKRPSEDEEIFYRAAQITEYVREYNRERWGHEERWNMPVNPAIHSLFRKASYPLYPPREDIMDAIVPLHAAYPKVVKYLLENYYDYFFQNHERAASFLQLAVEDDMKAQAGLHGLLEPENLQRSSEVLRLLTQYFMRRYPDGADTTLPDDASAETIGPSAATPTAASRHEMQVTGQEVPHNDARYLKTELSAALPLAQLPASPSRSLGQWSPQIYELGTEISD